LYAMTFFACTPGDIYTIDGIFSMQPERHADNAKKISGNSVFNHIIRGDKEELVQVVLAMGKTLLDVQSRYSPRVNLADTVMLAKNYTLFKGLSEIGRVFERVSAIVPTVPDSNSAHIPSAVRAARELMNYALLVQLCDYITVMADDEDYRNTPAYKKCIENF
ncbi:MAG: hypothetical protein FWF82_04885, partial [Oscillospiraceae bacterium]|nr:hypothetical protein [Oscillospiraceae bacterium]